MHCPRHYAQLQAFPGCRDYIFTLSLAVRVSPTSTRLGVQAGKALVVEPSPWLLRAVGAWLLKGSLGPTVAHFTHMCRFHPYRFHTVNICFRDACGDTALGGSSNSGELCLQVSLKHGLPLKVQPRYVASGLLILSLMTSRST